MITTEQQLGKGSGKQRPAKSGDLPSKGTEMCQLKLKPGGASGAENMMVTKAHKATQTCRFLSPLMRGGLHGPDHKTPYNGLHIVQT